MTGAFALDYILVLTEFPCNSRKIMET